DAAVRVADLDVPCAAAVCGLRERDQELAVGRLAVGDQRVARPEGHGVPEHPLGVAGEVLGPHGAAGGGRHRPAGYPAGAPAVRLPGRGARDQASSPTARVATESVAKSKTPSAPIASSVASVLATAPSLARVHAATRSAGAASGPAWPSTAAAMAAWAASGSC